MTGCNPKAYSMEEESLLEKPVEINLKKLKLKKVFKKIKRYKISLIFGLVGLVLIVTGIFSLYYLEKSESKVEIVPAEEQKINKEIIIDVSGAVLKPGVYKLKEGDRLQDALIAAGGMSEDADREWVEKNLNLAVKLVDGNKVYIPKVGGASKEVEVSSIKYQVSDEKESGGVGQIAGVVSDKININTASPAELDTLPGIGEKTAAKIIAGRPYQKIEELVERKIIYKSTFEKIREMITVY